LKDKPPVSYKEKTIPKTDKISKEDVEINIGEGENTEFYTEEHEKLLGDCQNAWNLCVDGYGEDGQRVYDPDNGKSCHQCRSEAYPGICHDGCTSTEKSILNINLISLTFRFLI